MRSILLLVIIVLMITHTNGQIPEGEMKGPFKMKSSIYPGTIRDYWIYVPKQYSASQPACLMVLQDGLSCATGWKLPRTLDSLINLKKIPVMIGVFVDHGKVEATSSDAFPRYNRSFEYDGLGDRYANFLLEELLPEVSKTYNFSKNPDDRSIAGASSGAICAFNAAWERPDQFRRVLSTIGTYVGLRGADEFVTLVRKTEAKPLRVYLEDGDQDLNIYAGDWWMANQSMLSALTYAGYEVNHGWGHGGHDSKHTRTIIADALEWLWKDYPKGIQTHKGIAPRINLLIDGEPWKEIALNGHKISNMTVDANGNIVFSEKSALYKIDDQGLITTIAKLKAEATVVSSGEALVYAWLRDTKKIITIDASGVSRDVVPNCDVSSMMVSPLGLYFTDAGKDRIGFYSFAGKSTKYFATDFHPMGLAISGEKTFLNVGSTDVPFGYSFRISNDGTLAEGQAYAHYHIPYGKVIPGLGGMTVDAQNLLYASTSLGIQVSDQLGRVNFIFSKPADGCDDVKLGGQNGDMLYTSGGGKLFVRKVSAKGISSYGPSVKPPKPGL